MRVPIPYPKLNKSPNKGQFLRKMQSVFRFAFILFLGLSITFSNYAEDDDSDFLDKVLEDKPKRTEPKKLLTQTQPQSPAQRDKKKKVTKNTKKPAKAVTKQDPTRRLVRPAVPISPPPAANTGNSNLPQIQNSKLNLEYWVHEELIMSPQNIPGFETPKVSNNTNPTNLTVANNPDKPVEKKSPEKTVETKPNAIFTFLNEYKKIIFIFAAIIIFAIYRLRYAGQRNYNNSGRIFSKFRNK